MLTVRYLRPRPSPLQSWWRENAPTALGLAAWAAVLLQCASFTPLEQTDMVHPYRVESVDGAVFVLRQDSQAACKAGESATAVCIAPEDSYPSRTRSIQETAP